MGYFNDSTRALVGVSIPEFLALLFVAMWVVVIVVSVVGELYLALFG